jgi:hypothetical protein
MNLRNNSGAALIIVLIFSVFAVIAASLYIAAQFTAAKPSLVGPASFQAQCTARSGVWKGIELLSGRRPDTLSTINTLDSMFNKKLFGAPTQAVTNAALSALGAVDSPTIVAPFSDDSFGAATLTQSYTPCFRVLASTGTFRSAAKTVRAFFGGKLFSSPDTVCFLTTSGVPEGVIDGKVGFASPAKTSPGSDPQDGGLRIKELAALVAYYRSRISESGDTMMPAAPLTIQSAERLAGLPGVINGPLFVNGVSGRLVWREKRRIIVLGDVQITGDVSIRDVEFVTTGEVKCCDDARLSNVSVFCCKRFSVDDRAVFSGSVLTLSSVLVCKTGRVEDKSVIVAYGAGAAAAADSARGTKKMQLPVSVFLTQNASVDGTVVACGSPGGIRIDHGVVVRGIVWASGPVVHEGSLYGILHAQCLTDVAGILSRIRTQPGEKQPVQKNILTGTIRRFPGVLDYPCPFFLGASVIARWEEG